MMKITYLGRGTGTLMIRASLLIAKDLRFKSMQFNRLLIQNTNAVKLYHKLGFRIIGTIPEATRLWTKHTGMGILCFANLKIFKASDLSFYSNN